MDDRDDLAPAVESILGAARDRGGGENRVDVNARSLPAAVERATAEGRVPIVAEVKPTSPTTDGERTDDPVALAEAMVDGGAAAISVLTEPDHFGGSPATLRRIRDAVDVPVLRKDFVLHEDQLDVVAADVVLLIVRFLDEDGTDDLETLLAAARNRGLQALVEVHTEGELERAIDAGAEIVGINNRDLARLEVDLGTFERVAPAARRQSRGDAASGGTPSPAPENVTLIAESGIATAEDVRRMRRAGADALLVGSAIMDHGDADESLDQQNAGRSLHEDVRENTRRLTDATAEADHET